MSVRPVSLLLCLKAIPMQGTKETNLPKLSDLFENIFECLTFKKKVIVMLVVKNNVFLHDILFKSF